MRRATSAQVRATRRQYKYLHPATTPTKVTQLAPSLRSDLVKSVIKQERKAAAEVKRKRRPTESNTLARRMADIADEKTVATAAAAATVTAGVVVSGQSPRTHQKAGTWSGPKRFSSQLESKFKPRTPPANLHYEAEDYDPFSKFFELSRIRPRLEGVFATTEEAVQATNLAAQEAEESQEPEDVDLQFADASESMIPDDTPPTTSSSNGQIQKKIFVNSDSNKENEFITGTDKKEIETAEEQIAGQKDFTRLRQKKKGITFDDAKTGNKEAGPSEISSSSAEQKEKGKRRSSQLIKRGSTTMEPIKKVNFDDVYSVYKQVGLGRFGQLKLAENKNAKCKIALRYFPTAQFKQVDFIREYNCSFFLSPHPNVIDTYEGMFQAHDDSAFFFVQEICSGITLKEAVEGSSSGIGEPATRSVMEKVLSALEFMHSENLVHRYIRAESILIFDPREYSKVKLTNFGLTKKVDSSVKYQDIVSGSNYHAPELCETVVNEFYTVSRAIDMWAIGIVFYYCLKGKFPWQKASIMCKPYWEWEQWLKRKSPQLPKRWEPFSEKSLKILKKTLNPKHKDRWSAKDVRKCILKEKLLKPTKVAEE